MSDENDNEWVRKKRSNWPEGSFQRQFPGSRSILDVFNKVKSKDLDLTATQTTEKERATKIDPTTGKMVDLEIQHKLYLSMTEAIETISEKFKSNLEFSPRALETKKYLDRLEIKSFKEIEAWRNGWLELIKSHAANITSQERSTR